MSGQATDRSTGEGTAHNLRYPAADLLFRELPAIAEDMRARPEEGAEPLAWIGTLAASPTPEEAITFAAYALPARHAVWWGHECLRHMERVPDATDGRMLDLVAAWVAEPGEDTRYAALDAALDSPAKTPGVWIALAAGWSGGSMVARGLDPVPPAPHLCARAVNAGVLSAVARMGAEARGPALSACAQMAVILARGG